MAHSAIDCSVEGQLFNTSRQQVPLIQPVPPPAPPTTTTTTVSWLPAAVLPGNVSYLPPPPLSPWTGPHHLKLDGGCLVVQVANLLGDPANALGDKGGSDGFHVSHVGVGVGGVTLEQKEVKIYFICYSSSLTLNGPSSVWTKRTEGRK